MNGISLEKMSMVELDALAMLIREEKDKREAGRFDELVKTACDALNAIRLEFPWAEMRVEFHCSECETTDDYNLFEIFSSFSPKDFSRN